MKTREQKKTTQIIAQIIQYNFVKWTSPSMDPSNQKHIEWHFFNPVEISMLRDKRCACQETLIERRYLDERSIELSVVFCHN